MAVEEPQAEPVKEKTKKEKPQKQGNSLIKQLYLDHGYDGLEKMLRDLGSSLGGFFGKLYKTFTIDELYIKMVTVGGDAADTAIKHGRLCAWLYPVLGKLISTCKVKKYDFDISPDFLAPKSTASAFVRFHIRPIKITNAAVVSPDTVAIADLNLGGDIFIAVLIVAIQNKCGIFFLIVHIKTFALELA